MVMMDDPDAPSAARSSLTMLRTKEMMREQRRRRLYVLALILGIALGAVLTIVGYLLTLWTGTT